MGISGGKHLRQRKQQVQRPWGWSTHGVLQKYQRPVQLKYRRGAGKEDREIMQVKHNEPSVNTSYHHHPACSRVCGAFKRRPQATAEELSLCICHLSRF